MKQIKSVFFFKYFGITPSLNIWCKIPILTRPYHFKFFEGCLPQILLLINNNEIGSKSRESDPLVKLKMKINSGVKMTTMEHSLTIVYFTLYLITRCNLQPTELAVFPNFPNISSFCQIPLYQKCKTFMVTFLVGSNKPRHNLALRISTAKFNQNKKIRNALENNSAFCQSFFYLAQHFMKNAFLEVSW